MGASNCLRLTEQAELLPRLPPEPSIEDPEPRLTEELVSAVLQGCDG
jgi:hypothetical protein